MLHNYNPEGSGVKYPASWDIILNKFAFFKLDLVLLQTKGCRRHTAFPNLSHFGHVHVVITEVFNLEREPTKQKLTLSSTPAGTTIGLKDKEWGQIGVIMIAGTFGWIIEAPAAAA